MAGPHFPYVPGGSMPHHATGANSRPETQPRPYGGELNAAIARGVVRRHTQFTGRGPSRARAFFNGNIVVVILEDAMTPAEQSLAAAGKVDTVRQMRRESQAAMRDELVAVVEEVTGSTVVAYMSDNHVEPDLAAEVFVLDAPVSG
jgi:uncharacterized protein YbcI